MSDRLMRVGVVGLGTIGQTHVSALRKVGVQQLYGADPSPTARQHLQPYLAVCFADLHEMLSAVALDAVVIATPPDTHRELAIAALEAGPGVLCEKPLAVTLEDGEAIAVAARRSPAPFQVGFCHRFQPQVSALRDLVRAGSIGRPVLVNVSFVHGLSQLGREWIVDAGRAGGGVLFDSGSHAIDLFRFLAGDIDAVHGFTATLERQVAASRVEDTAVASLRSGAVLGTIVLAWKTPPWEGLVEVVGSTGRARVEYDGDRVSLRIRAGQDGWRRVTTGRENRFVAQMRHFLACVRGEQAPLATLRDGMEATRTVLSIYQSAGVHG
jgi:predicted dehydrogenase